MSLVDPIAYLSAGTRAQRMTAITRWHKFSIDVDKSVERTANAQCRLRRMRPRNPTPIIGPSYRRAPYCCQTRVCCKSKLYCRHRDLYMSMGVIQTSKTGRKLRVHANATSNVAKSPQNLLQPHNKQLQIQSNNK